MQTLISSFQLFRGGEKQIGKRFAVSNVIAGDELYVMADIKDLGGFASAIGVHR